MKARVLVFAMILVGLVPPADAKRFIVVFDNTVTTPAEVDAKVQAIANFGVTILHTYYDALQGCCFSGTEAQRDAVVAAVGAIDLVENDVATSLTSQTLPTGVDRINADLSSVAKIDGVDERVDVDLAILDTGIYLSQDIDDGGDPNHPVYTTGADVPDSLNHEDLNVVKFVNKVAGNPDHNDRFGHGTQVAGIAAAVDNNVGVVGVAPGARLWAVKVLAPIEEHDCEPLAGTCAGASDDGCWGDVIAGIDYVTTHAESIEVANMSLGGCGRLESLRRAIQSSVAAGVVYVVAAGNFPPEDVYGPDALFDTQDDWLPANYPEVCTVTGLADRDGQPGGLGVQDDVLDGDYNFSRTVVAQTPVLSPGAALDLAAPAVSVLTTTANGGYMNGSGTSMAAPHVSGAAGLLIAAYGRPVDASGVARVRDFLIRRGEQQIFWRNGYTNDRDARHEPLVNAEVHPNNNIPLHCEVASLAAGNGHVLALRNDGTAASWGWNGQGELGDGTFAWRTVAGPVSPLSGLTSIRAVAAGQGWFSLGLKNDGSVWSWGNNSKGQLGIGVSPTPPSPLPVPVDSLALTGLRCLGLSDCIGAIAVAAGKYHALALKHDGTVWAWGNNDHGQLGNGTSSSSSLPVLVSNLANVAAVSAGSRFSLALDHAGSVWAWGQNTEGQLGDGTTSGSNVPVQVSASTGMTDVIAIDAGGSHALAIDIDANVWAWGRDIWGQLGIGSPFPGTFSSVPQQVTAINDAMMVAAGTNHSLAVRSDGTAWSWGQNAYGQLGDGTLNHSSVPIPVGGSYNLQITFVEGSMNVESGTGDYSLKIMHDAHWPGYPFYPRAVTQTLAWGDNTTGQLGDGTNQSSTLPRNSVDGCLTIPTSDSLLCPVYRDDDGFPETNASIDFRDDDIEKTIVVGADLTNALAARLWIYGQPYNFPGFDFVPRVDYFIRVNDDPSQEASFDVGLEYNYETQYYQWVSFDIPLGWLVQGSNTFFISEFDNVPFGAWEQNNLRIGIDTDHDYDRSWWFGNGLFCGSGPACAGELMIFLELCKEDDVVPVSAGSGLPPRFALGRVYPNPFNPSMTVHYEVPKGGGYVRIDLFDVRGRLVRSLWAGYRNGGRYTLQWDGKDNDGRSVASGIYLVRLQAPETKVVRKGVLVR